MNESEMDKRLLRNVQGQMEWLKKTHLNLPDCCQASSSEFASDELKQPPEVWEPFLRRMAGIYMQVERGQIEYHARRCESPIEELLFLALVLVGRQQADEVVYDAAEPAPFHHVSVLQVAPQVVVGKYRVDFAVTFFFSAYGGENRDLEFWHKGTVLVECDGHDFHERTKEQASHDKRKDRDLQAAGFKIYRYTGSDVWSKCLECADEVFRAASSLAHASEPLTDRPRERRPRG